MQAGRPAVNKIPMNTPVVEMDGDEMTRVLWKMIKEELISPFVDLQTVYFDLGLKNRDATDDAVTTEAAKAVKKYHVGIKCATITPNADRVREYGLRRMYKSPNGTLRAFLDGTVFRTPITVPCLKPYIRTWEKPITIARHAYGDIYRAAECPAETGDTAALVLSRNGKEVSRTPIYTFEGPGIVQGTYNKDSSIEAFAEACFRFALEEKEDLWFSCKDTISKTYDGRFRDIFERLYEEKYKPLFDAAGLTFLYTLIDDAVARTVRSRGGFLWACKNYDGDVMSDMISSGFGSIAMMKSVLVSPAGDREYEAAHGTITRHYRRYLRGEQPSSNPVATIFAWTGGLGWSGKQNNNPELVRWSRTMENAVLKTIESGGITKDLLPVYDGTPEVLSSAEFLARVREKYLFLSES
jgi:isocitrate dehydrogenase